MDQYVQQLGSTTNVQCCMVKTEANVQVPISSHRTSMRTQWWWHQECSSGQGHTGGWWWWCCRLWSPPTLVDV